MTNPKPGDLTIFVRAENVPNQPCNWKGIYTYCHNGMERRNGSGDLINTKCPKCKGTKKRTITLEGGVRVELVLGYDDDGDPISSIRLLMGKHSIIADDGAQMITFIVEALYSNTCPDEIRAQLQVVEYEDRD